jgi:hypothetical protein
VIPESQLPAHTRVLLLTNAIQALFPCSGIHVARMMALAIDSDEFHEVGELFTQKVKRETGL